ncbi:amidohydrolase family protein [Nibricoccus aquaticus]|nr:TatD family hydrolase [Nibricoccus aquaticus]
MPSIDAHVHLYPEDLNRAPGVWATAHGERHWAMLCTRVRKSGRAVQGFPSVDELLHAMDEAGVDRAVLQGWYWENHATCVWQNRFYAACVKAHPDRLSAFATLHAGAGREAVISEVRRVKAEGFCGIGELSPHSQGFSVEDETWRAVLELAGELRLPVNLHVTEPEGRNYPGKIATPLGDFVRMAKAHPATVFILAHWGARLPLDAEFGAEARALKNLYYDTAASPLIYPRADVREMLGQFGAERVLFGTDYPLELFPNGEGEGGAGTMRGFVDAFRAAGLGEAECAAVLGGNAARVIGLR